MIETLQYMVDLLQPALLPVLPHAAPRERLAAYCCNIWLKHTVAVYGCNIWLDHMAYLLPSALPPVLPHAAPGELRVLVSKYMVDFFETYGRNFALYGSPPPARTPPGAPACPPARASRRTYLVFIVYSLGFRV